MIQNDYRQGIVIFIILSGAFWKIPRWKILPEPGPLLEYASYRTIFRVR